jgi:lipopolysaccharide transport system permease protein
MQKKIIITSKSSWFDVGIKEVWLYRDLWSMLIKRDFIAMYKQTIMGPIWYLVQPVVTIIIFSLVFSRIGNISTKGLPAPIFYLTGLSLWGYFADCVLKVSSVFRDNQHIIGKVYFPRLIIPLSIVVSALVKYLIQIF